MGWLHSAVIDFSVARFDSSSLPHHRPRFRFYILQEKYMVECPSVIGVWRYMAISDDPFDFDSLASRADARDLSLSYVGLARFLVAFHTRTESPHFQHSRKLDYSILGDLARAVESWCTFLFGGRGGRKLQQDLVWTKVKIQLSGLKPILLRSCWNSSAWHLGIL